MPHHRLANHKAS